MFMPKNCQRCGKETNCMIMSMFNTDMICEECKERERNHKDYERAREIEYQEVKRGNYNFKGIGKPHDL